MRSTILSWQRRRDHTSDEGFSLVEVIVALGLATVVLLALLSSSVFALQATVDARRNQQAADYLNLAIENVRSLAYAGASMQSMDIIGDLAITTVAGVKKYDSGAGLETVDHRPTGQVTPHIVTADTTNGPYTTKRYVTIPPTAVVDPTTGQPSVRRLTVEVSYSVRGNTTARRSSTLLTLTRRGLPLPNYTWKYRGPAAVVANVPTWVKNPENGVSYGLVLANLGARDSWSVSSSTLGWSYFVDTNRDGLWSEDATEPQVNPANTGLIEPGAEPVYLVAHRVIGPSENGTTTTVFTASSDALPEAQYQKTVTTRLTVTTGVITPPVSSPSPTPASTVAPAPCTPGTALTATPGATPAAPTTNPSYTLNQLNLYNGASTGGDSMLRSSSAMGRDTTALRTSICNWATDLQTSQAGRPLLGPTDAVPTALAAGARTAEWTFQPANVSQDDYRGEPVLVAWLQCLSGTPSIDVSLLSQAGTAPPVGRATATMTTPGCTSTGFTRYSVKLTGMPIFGIALTDKLLLRLTSTGAVRIGHGASDLNTTFTIGMK